MTQYTKDQAIELIKTLIETMDRSPILLPKVNVLSNTLMKFELLQFDTPLRDVERLIQKAFWEETSSILNEAELVFHFLETDLKRYMNVRN
jgi:hypothetical protein